MRCDGQIQTIKHVLFWNGCFFLLLSFLDVSKPGVLVLHHHTHLGCARCGYPRTHERAQFEQHCLTVCDLRGRLKHARRGHEARQRGVGGCLRGRTRCWSLRWLWLPRHVATQCSCWHTYFKCEPSDDSKCSSAPRRYMNGAIELFALQPALQRHDSSSKIQILRLWSGAARDVSVERSTDGHPCPSTGAAVKLAANSPFFRPALHSCTRFEHPKHQ